MLQNTIDRHQPLECYRVAIANRCISQVICLVTILANSPEAGELLNGEILVIRPKFMAFGIDARTAIFAATYARDHNIAQKLPRPRTDEHTSELPSLMRTSSDVDCL